ncbi:hypothetical protein L210DRAFT_984820 [Boletus edulis BED1]|uniref:DUF6570 domain-containing protein n=1 Tax=Boletus edulis BED1 TaxID=1328754 RepID=A0AAD4GDL0_BOLED|nr:hypothetical protein L210DRAFT_984820 [Boletus edulis BED1]
MLYHTALQGLTVKELIRAIGSDRLTSKEKRSQQLIEEVVNNSIPFQTFIVEAYEEKLRNREENERGRLKRCRFLEEGHFHSTINDDEFLMCVDDNVSNEATSAFIDRTGNEKLEQAVCVVCAGEFFKSETERHILEEIEHKDILHPSHAHADQHLYFGMLLYEEAVTMENGDCCRRICHSCFKDVKAGKLPSNALANNLWIGNIPPELSVLSLPEQVLISRYYAASYIVKLYPCSRGVQTSSGQMFNSALRGNVTSYRMNTAEVASMIEGDLLPHHPNVLAATIGVTLVGAKNIPDRCLPSFLRVSRRRVHDALVFLKNNNPFYEHIRISEENLSLLPDNSIPAQLLAIVKELPNAAIIEGEGSGYVIDEEDGDSNEISENELGDEIDLEEDSVEAVEEAPHVIPLSANGIIDPGMSEVKDDELLGYAMQNATKGVDEKYFVRRGQNFVNEYPRQTNVGGLVQGDEDNPNHLLGAFPCLFPYGCGGFEVDRPKKLSYAEHVRWMLRYADRRFRLDIRFVFQVFGVLQKRQVCRSTCLQISKPDFNRYEEEIRKIDAQTLAQSGQEEKEGKPISSAAVRALKRHTSAVRSRVMATDESRRGEKHIMIVVI